MVVISVGYLLVPFVSREGCRVSWLGGTMCGLLQTPSLVSTYLVKEHKNSHQTILITHWSLSRKTQDAFERKRSSCAPPPFAKTAPLNELLKHPRGSRESSIIPN